MKAYVQKQPDEVPNCQHDWFLITIYNGKESIVALQSNQEEAYAKCFCVHNLQKHWVVVP